MANPTRLQQLIDRLLQREVEQGRLPLDNPGVVLEWKQPVYDASEYGTQDKPPRRHRLEVDADLEGWEPII